MEPLPRKSYKGLKYNFSLEVKTCRSEPRSCCYWFW